MKAEARSAGLAILAVVFLTAGGVGYAASAGQFSDGGGSHEGNLQLLWVSPAHAQSVTSFVVCSVTFSSSTLTFRASNLAPGTSCVLTSTIKNVAAIPGTLQSSSHLGEPRGCSLFTYVDNVHGATPPAILAGGTFGYHATLSLASGAGNMCEKQSATLSVTITGSPQCTDRDHDGDCDSEDSHPSGLVG